MVIADLRSALFRWSVQSLPAAAVSQNVALFSALSSLVKKRTVNVEVCALFTPSGHDKLRKKNIWYINDLSSHHWKAFMLSFRHPADN